jgi:hypothetical protein
VNPTPADHDQVRESDAPQPLAPELEVGVGFRLFRAGVCEQNQVGTDARAGQLDQQCGRVDAKTIRDDERNL